jgi:hypothetical protein
MTDPSNQAPIPFRLLLDEAMKLTRKHFHQLYWPVAIPTALMLGLMNLSQFLTLQNIENQADPLAGLGTVGLSCGILAVFAVFGLLFYTAQWAGCTQAIEGTFISFPDTLRWTLRGQVLGTVVLYGLFVFVGFILCIAPGIFVFFGFLLYIPVMVHEGIFGMDALKASWDLIRYNPQRSFLRASGSKVVLLMLVGWILSYGLSLAIQLPIGLLQQALMFRDATAEGGTGISTAVLLLSLPGGIISGLASSVVQMYLGMGLGLLYFDIKRRRSGEDLEAELDQLTGGEPAL